MDQGKLFADLINHMTLYSHCPQNYINYMPKELKEFVIRIREETKYLIHITSDANTLILHELLAYIVYNNHNNVTFTIGPNMDIRLKSWPEHTVGDLIRSLEAIKDAIDKSK